MQDITKSLKWENFDIVGVALSFICAIHCVILPILLAMLHSVGWSVHSHSNLSFEWIMVFIIVALGTTVLVRGYLNHRRWEVILFLVFSVVIFLFVRPAFGDQMHMHALTSVLGGTSFIIGHIYNWNLCRTCPVCRFSNAACKNPLDRNVNK